ncbi:MAG: AAA family ATPase, partial [Clostridiales bacterium]|nr:AAA family ATPase [Clostridiales bacterium]
MGDRADGSASGGTGGRAGGGIGDRAGKKHIFGAAGRYSSSASFAELRRGDYFYVDKTAFIKHFLDDAVNNKVSLICRPRRFGKSLNMDTLRCFLSDREDS